MFADVSILSPAGLLNIIMPDLFVSPCPPYIGVKSMFPSTVNAPVLTAPEKVPVVALTVPPDWFVAVVAVAALSAYPAATFRQLPQLPFSRYLIFMYGFVTFLPQYIWEPYLPV